MYLQQCEKSPFFIPGPGGSLMAVSFILQQFFGKAFQNLKILFLPAGGFSQRLPSASMLGKIFTTLPLGNPIYQMLELQLAMYIDLPSKMSAGMFLACADTFILYDADSSSPWTFDKPGITAFAHPSDLEVGRNHGVFVLPRGCLKPEKVSIVECEQFLHKVNPDMMRSKGAVLPEFFNPEGESILIDSSYFIDYDTLAKLINYYTKVQPLKYEIDSHGDFLQALGTKADSSYISNMDNAVNQSQSLLKMRQEVYEVLRGTPLFALVLKESKFYHIGTTKEYIYHFCENKVLQSELGLQQDVCSRYTGESFQKGAVSEASCVMNCSLPANITIPDNVVLEFCRFEGSMHIGKNSIISNCSFVNQSPDPISLPQNVFLHTVCIKHLDKMMYATVVFDVDDNLKKGHPQSDVSNLVFLGKSLKAIFCQSSTHPESIFEADEEKCTLWNAKLFQPQPTMEQAFAHALRIVTIARGEGGSDVTSLFENGLSMKNVLNQKYIEGMLAFRRNLTLSIRI